MEELEKKKMGDYRRLGGKRGEKGRAGEGKTQYTVVGKRSRK